MDGDNQRESFGATSGRVFGIIGLLVGAALVVGGLSGSPITWEVPSIGVLILVLSWTALLRPSVSVAGGDLMLRGMVDTVSIPLGAIEQVSVRQVLSVVAGDRKYSSAAVGRGRREMFRDQVRGTGAGGGGAGGAGALGGASTLGGAIGADAGDADGASFGLYVESRLSSLAADARTRAGVRVGSREQDALAEGIRRTWAWPEIAALSASVLAVVLAVVL
ncbi:hypothetical protein [Nocardioides plantarum]|uniref:PH domain-containing protein n=1 Tax=Nocardioides plantarum TaxID=29299 RepID=A0ABV5K757_9ACTN|nr:hypothetical protein [Nocardioides plantarum]